MLVWAVVKRSLFLAALLFILLLAGGREPAPRAAENSVAEHNAVVSMRDGVGLKADILRPGSGGPFPTLVYRTPYGKDAAQKDYTTFRKAVARGYAVVIQDVRGRYASEGEFDAYRNEGRDGYDTIEWAAKQPWSNGAVGTFGLSYPGAVQWLAAIESPPHLKAMVPAMTFSTPRNFFYSGGAFDLSWPEWILVNIAPDVRARKNLPGPRTAEEAEAAWQRNRARIAAHVPLATLSDMREVAPWYYQWLRHPPADSWWDWAEIRGKYGRVSAAVLNVSGWHDEAYSPEGAITNFLGLLASRHDQSDKRTQLLLGPWTHGVDSTARTHSGEREFGPAATIDYDEVVLRWMDRYVKGVASSSEDEKPVRYFVMGANVWRESNTWPPQGQPTAVYLEGPASAGARGRLQWSAVAAEESASRFISDPEDPVTDVYAGHLGAHDYRGLESNKDLLLFDSAPLTSDLEVAGRIAVEIYLSCDAPDVDLWARLLDVAPDGRAFNLMSPGLDVVRASTGGGARRELLEPGKVYRVRLENLFTGNRFLKGHRLRVQISAAFFPDFSRNLQTGQLESDSAGMRKATITVYHDRKHPSRLLLPVTGTATKTSGKSSMEMGEKPVERRER